MTIMPRIAAIAGLLYALAACVPSTTAPPEPQAPLIWPGEPDQPRIAYVRAFSRPEDLGITRGFFQRLGDLLFGASEVRLVRPMAVVTVGDVVFVADPGVKGVHRLDPGQGTHDVIRGVRDAVLPSPVGLARGPDGEVYVTDSALGKVFVIAAGSRVATEVRLSAQVGQPTGIAVDSSTRRLYVVDTTAHRIAVFDRGGALVNTIGRRGTEDGEFNYPTLLWRSPDGRIYLTDSLNFRIQMLDSEGRFLGKFGRHGDGTGDLARQKGIATDRHGHVYVVDSLFHAVQIFDQQGTFLLSLGAIGRDRGEFWLPTGIHITDDDTVYVADSFNRRVQVFRYIGGAT